MPGTGPPAADFGGRVDARGVGRPILATLVVVEALRAVLRPREPAVASPAA